jgi:hypothetical protein
MLNVALTHDIDRIDKTTQYITHSIRGIKNLSFRVMINNLKTLRNWKNEYWNFERIMEIEDKYSVRSTFFFLNEPRTFNILDFKNFRNSFGRYSLIEKRVVDIIKLLDKSGWEIGLHGSFNSYKDLNLLKNQKGILENIIGREVAGIRQHYLNLQENRTWELQSEAGFLYDSSWGYAGSVGFKERRIKPFHPLKNKFTVFPLVIMDYCFAAESDKWKRFDEICGMAESENGILVLNWHNCALNRNDFPDSEENYIKCIEKCVNLGARFKTLYEYYQLYNE